MVGIAELMRLPRWGTRVSPQEDRGLVVATVHAEHAEHVWRSLQRLGIREPDLEDLLQEVFVVVHKRLHTFDWSCSMQAWLFGICKHVARSHRRRAYLRRETTLMTPPESSSEGVSPNPEEAFEAREEGEELSALLQELDSDKRVVLVMFEIEELSCEAIAETLGIPVGTVYSRLHAARKAFERALSRRNASAARRGGR